MVQTLEFHAQYVKGKVGWMGTITVQGWTSVSIIRHNLFLLYFVTLSSSLIIPALSSIIIFTIHLLFVITIVNIIIFSVSCIFILKLLFIASFFFLVLIDSFPRSRGLPILSDSPLHHE